jgi:hypothetical protein
MGQIRPLRRAVPDGRSSSQLRKSGPPAFGFPASAVCFSEERLSEAEGLSYREGELALPPASKDSAKVRELKAQGTYPHRQGARHRRAPTRCWMPAIRLPARRHGSAAGPGNGSGASRACPGRSARYSEAALFSATPQPKKIENMRTSPPMVKRSGANHWNPPRSMSPQRPSPCRSRRRTLCLKNLACSLAQLLNGRGTLRSIAPYPI